MSNSRKIPVGIREVYKNQISKYHAQQGIPVASTEIQTRILKLALRYGDVEVQSDLAAYAGLDASLRAEVRSIKTEQVRVAFLRRADITDEERINLLQAEKRSKVLKALLGKESPEEVKTAVLALYQKRPTKILSEALIDLEDGVTDDILKIAYSQLVPKYSDLPASRINRLRHLFNKFLQAGEVDFLIENFAPYTLWTTLITTNLSSKQLLELINKSVVPYADNQFERYQAAHKWTKDQIARESLSALQTFFSDVASAANLSQEVVDKVQELSKHPITTILHGKSDLLTNLARSVRTRQSVEASHFASVSGKGLLDLMGYAVNLTFSEIAELLKNPYLTSEQVDTLLPVNGSTLGRGELGYPLNALKGVPEDRLDLLIARKGSYLPENFFTLYAKPESAEARVIKAITKLSKHKGYDYQRSTQIRSLESGLEAAGLSEKGLLSMPWERIQSSHYGSLRRISQRAITLLEKRLGESEAKWELFATLATEQDDTLGSIIDTVDALS